MALMISLFAGEAGDLGPDAGDLGLNAGDLPVELRNRLTILTAKARVDKLWPVILWLCATQPGMETCWRRCSGAQ
jgi:hypothetical protein